MQFSVHKTHVDWRDIFSNPPEPPVSLDTVPTFHAMLKRYVNQDSPSTHFHVDLVDSHYLFGLTKLVQGSFPPPNPTNEMVISSVPFFTKVPKTYGFRFYDMIIKLIMTFSQGSSGTMHHPYTNGVCYATHDQRWPSLRDRGVVPLALGWRSQVQLSKHPWRSAFLLTVFVVAAFEPRA